MCSPVSLLNTENSSAEPSPRKSAASSNLRLFARPWTTRRSARPLTLAAPHAIGAGTSTASRRDSQARLPAALQETTWSRVMARHGVCDLLRPSPRESQQDGFHRRLDLSCYWTSRKRRQGHVHGTPGMAKLEAAPQGHILK